MTKEREFDLQERLVDYAVRIIKLSEALPETRAGAQRRRAEPTARRGSASYLGYWIFLVGCWILKIGENNPAAANT